MRASMEMLFTNIPHLSRWEHHSSSYSTERATFVSLLPLTCIYQSVILSLQPSTFFPRIQVLLTNSSATVLVQIAIISHVGYCSSHLAGCPVSTVAFLQLLPNITASLNLLKYHLLSSSGRNPPVASSLSQ